MTRGDNKEKESRVECGRKNEAIIMSSRRNEQSRRIAKLALSCRASNVFAGSDRLALAIYQRDA